MHQTKQEVYTKKSCLRKCCVQFYGNDDGDDDDDDDNDVCLSELLSEEISLHKLHHWQIQIYSRELILSSIFLFICYQFHHLLSAFPCPQPLDLISN